MPVKPPPPPPLPTFYVCAVEIRDDGGGAYAVWRPQNKTVSAADAGAAIRACAAWLRGTVIAIPTTSVVTGTVTMDQQTSVDTAASPPVLPA